jgi:hypothetical protein
MANLQTHYHDRRFFHCIGPYLGIVQNRLWYPFETCIFNRVWLIVEFGPRIAPNLVPILWISQPCLNRGYSQMYHYRLIFGFLS